MTAPLSLSCRVGSGQSVVTLAALLVLGQRSRCENVTAAANSRRRPWSPSGSALFSVLESYPPSSASARSIYDMLMVGGGSSLIDRTADR